MPLLRKALRVSNRSMLAFIFFFSFSSSCLYFIYVAPGIGESGAAPSGSGGEGGGGGRARLSRAVTAAGMARVAAGEGRLGCRNAILPAREGSGRPAGAAVTCADPASLFCCFQTL